MEKNKDNDMETRVVWIRLFKGSWKYRANWFGRFWHLTGLTTYVPGQMGVV